MKTLMPKQLWNNKRDWYIIDAKDKTLWRLASDIVKILKWKNKVSFVPHIDNWDYVIVINSDKISVTWNKLKDKIYYRHTWFMWGLKKITLEKLFIKKSTEVLKKAVSGMLPKNKLRSNMLSRLKLVIWQEHSYKAQKPKILTL